MLGAVKKTLLLYAHPNAHSSRANRRLVSELKSLPNLTVHSLYEQYPEFYIDVAAEQRLLREHQLIIWQHPLYWYSMPPLMKLWIDQVLAFDFAYGPEGKALHGKQLMLSLTVGGAKGAYRPGEAHGHPLSTYLAPYEQTARFCGMDWQPPKIFYEALGADDASLEAHADELRAAIETLALIRREV
jgi:glutathione-regulated potassium-efflux system ancillary protein KefF